MKRQLLALVPLAIASAANAAGFVDPATLDARIAAFTGQPIGDPGGAATEVDRRLRLADCGDNVVLGWRTERRDAVVVSCAGAASWRIFVPAKAAAGGATLAALTPGTAVVARAEPVIRRGDPVTIQSGTTGFSVSSEGVAMADATPGARLRVAVAGSRVPIQGIAVEPGLVTLPGS